MYRYTSGLKKLHNEPYPVGLTRNPLEAVDSSDSGGPGTHSSAVSIVNNDRLFSGAGLVSGGSVPDQGFWGVLEVQESVVRETVCFRYVIYFGVSSLVVGGISVVKVL